MSLRDQFPQYLEGWEPDDDMGIETEPIGPMIRQAMFDNLAAKFGTQQTEAPEPTVYEQYAATPKGAVELAAAELTATVSRLLYRMAYESYPTREEVAELLGVTEDRVTEVLEGDGNIRIAALAKYAAALGYTIRITAEPINGDGPSITADPTRRTREQRTV